MKKYIVLSVNDNPDYLFHVPLVCWAWRYFGWEPIIFFHGKKNTIPVKLPFEIGVADLCDCYDGYKSETIAQVSRLFGACVAPEGSYLMTSDIDMLPLSDYWKPDFEKVTTYGRDLSDRHYPICFIGMRDYRWEEIMDISSRDYNAQIARNLRQQKNMWTLDQDIITERINDSGYTPERIDRGIDKRTGYPIGRIDRSNWTLDHKQYIDCHMFHDVHRNEESFKKTLQMLHTVWPKENFSWWVTYYKEFRKLCQNKSQFAA